jgi:erythromycin esterase
MKTKITTANITSLLNENAIELNTGAGINAILEKIGDAKIVLMGEASHGTHEYYTWRSLISKRLIEEKNFSFVAVEGDWPDCFNVNRQIKSHPNIHAGVETTLRAFNRWPTWMWANWEMVAFTKWLKEINQTRKPEQKTGFYGLDVYSLWESLNAILEYLDKKDPQAKATALEVLKCFDPYRHDDGISYAKTARLVPAPCENEVIDLLVQMRKNAARYSNDPEETLNAEQNAWVIADAENYYRTMMHAGADSWNIRDRHMVDTLNRLMNHHGANTKAIVWEHNTHIGDARETDMWHNGMINVGQLVREENNPEDVFAIGFGSYSGTVIAAEEWGHTPEVMEVPAAKPGSWESILHFAYERNRNHILFMNEKMKKEIGKVQIPHRAIGVTYNPVLEHFLNYVPSTLPHRYDAFIYIDETTALHPLHTRANKNQVPETFPFGI